MGAAGRIIRRARLTTGTLATDLAKAVGVSPAYVSLIESGERPLNQRRADQFAEALGIERFCCACGRGLAPVSEGNAPE